MRVENEDYSVDLVNFRQWFLVLYSVYFLYFCDFVIFRVILLLFAD